MKLTSKGRYGVRALFFLAYHQDGAPAQMRDVASSAGIPLRFLEQIFNELKKAGLITAKRGPRGGYLLARAPEEISFGDVIRVLEGAPFSLGRAEVREARRDPVAKAWVDVASEVERCFDRMTLAEVCRSARALGFPKKVDAHGLKPLEVDGDYAI